MYPRVRNKDSTASGLEQLVARLAVDEVGDRGMWSTLCSVDWSRSDLDDLKASATEGVLHRILASDPIPHESRLPILGWEFILLDSMPGDNMTDWFKKRITPSEDVYKFLKMILLVLTRCRKVFELDKEPENKACTLAGNIVSRLHGECIELCRTDNIVKVTAIISYKIWTWTGASFNQSRWTGYEWSEVGVVGAIFLCTFIHDSRVRREFKAYCESGGSQRWKRVVSWLEVRILMLEAAQPKPLEDISDLVTVMFAISEMSGTAAKRIMDGPFPNTCISLLSQRRDISDLYLSTTATFVHGLMNGMDNPSRTPHTHHLMNLVDMGLLLLIRNVIVYTAMENDHPSYLKTWSCLRIIVSATLHHGAVPVIAKAFASLPSLWEENVQPDASERWNRIMKSVGVFKKGYDRFMDRAENGVCDNLECSEVEMKAKECGGCRQALYCNSACQSVAWAAGHKVDCRKYKALEIPTPRISLTSKIFLSHVLGFMLLSDTGANRERGDRANEVTTRQSPIEDGTFRIIDIGPRITDKKTFSIDSLLEYISEAAVPTQFVAMVKRAKYATDYKLAAFGLADPPKERFYVFGLFKQYDELDEEPSLTPLKVIEVTGLDRFVRG